MEAEYNTGVRWKLLDSCHRYPLTSVITSNSRFTAHETALGEILARNLSTNLFIWQNSCNNDEFIG